MKTFMKDHKNPCFFICKCRKSCIKIMKGFNSSQFARSISHYSENQKASFFSTNARQNASLLKSKCQNFQKFYNEEIFPNKENTNTWVYMTVWLASVLVYLNGLHGDFVHDDISVIKTNPDVIGSNSLYQLFCNDYWGKPMVDASSHKSYRPLTILTFRINYYFCGLNPFGYHVINVLLHSLATVLLARLLLTSFRLGQGASLMAASLFAVHPIHTEAVTGLVGRADILACISFFASILAYSSEVMPSSVEYRSTGVLWSVFWAGIGTFCKENGITAFVFVITWDILLHIDTFKRMLKGKYLPWEEEMLFRRIVLAICGGTAVLFIRLWMMNGNSPSFSDQDNPASFDSSFLVRTLTFLYLPAFNAWLLLCPFVIVHDWQLGSVPLVTSPLDCRNVFSLLLYVTISLLCYSGWKTHKENGKTILLSVALIVLPFIPASNLFFYVGFVVAERLLYIPSAGFCILIGCGLSKLGRRRNLILALIMILMTAKTLRRNPEWESRESLFTAGLKSLPNNAKMHYNFANLQKDLQRPEVAIYHYEEAIRLWPMHSSAHNNLATLLKDSLAAERHFREAIRSHPQHSRAFYNLAAIRQQQGFKSEALVLLQESIRCDPANRDAVSTLAGLYQESGRDEEAESLHVSLLSAKPLDSAGHVNYAVFLEGKNRFDVALKHYETAISLDPQNTVALVNGARIARKMRHNSKSELLYRRALSLVWDSEVGESLGILYLNTGNMKEAETIFRNVLKNDQDKLSSRVYLARVKLQEKSFEESEFLIQSVLEEEPSHKEALFHLSLLFSCTNRSAHALQVVSQLAEQCVSSSAFCIQLHIHSGDLHNDNQRHDLAVKSYLKAVELDPSSAHAHVNLGAIYHTKGEYIKAWDHYLIAQRQDPFNVLLQENMEKLRRAQMDMLQNNAVSCISTL